MIRINHFKDGMVDTFINSKISIKGFSASLISGVLKYLTEWFKYPKKINYTRLYLVDLELLLFAVLYVNTYLDMWYYYIYLFCEITKMI